MKKIGSISVLLLLLFASISSAKIIVQESFNSPIFPPTGWTTESDGAGGIWTWTDYGQPGNGYAKGEVVLSTPSWGYIKLQTDEFVLYEGDVVHINFNRRNNSIGATPYTTQWVIALNTRSFDYFSNSFSPSEGQIWVNTDIHYSIPVTSDQWSISWSVAGEIEQAGQTTIFFDIDEVLVEEISDAVEPTSLGNIKATFH